LNFDEAARYGIEAAGSVLLEVIKHVNATTPSELLQKTSMESKRF
jgi:hypothetical protein